MRLRRLAALTSATSDLLSRDLVRDRPVRGSTTRYRLLKAATPGPWIILEATREVPRRVASVAQDHPASGCRHAALALLEQVSALLLSTTSIPRDEEDALTTRDHPGALPARTGGGDAKFACRRHHGNDGLIC